MKKILLVLFFIICILSLYFQYYSYEMVPNDLRHYFETQPNITGKVSNDNVIFISVASYRDPQLKHTIESLLDNCYDKSLIRIVVCEQNSDDDNFSINEQPSVEVIKMDYTKARGPTWARYIIQQCWKGEQYYLQIDSHTRFVKNWDKLLREQIAVLPDKSCLSNYVSTYDINTNKVLKSPLRGPMIIQSIDPVDRFYRFNSRYVKSLPRPMESEGWSGCFSFSSSQIIIDIPYDPYLPFLFFGEEMDMYNRLLNKGWKLYVPSVPICFTLFNRAYRKTFWEHPDNKRVLPYSKQRLYKKFGWKYYIDPLLTKDINLY